MRRMMTTVTEEHGLSGKSARLAPRERFQMGRSGRRARLGRRHALGPGASFVLLGSVAVSLLASSSAPTPLYPLYQAQWGFSAITTTIVFGAYAVAVLI